MVIFYCVVSVFYVQDKINIWDALAITGVGVLTVLIFKNVLKKKIKNSVMENQHL